MRLLIHSQSSMVALIINEIHRSPSICISSIYVSYMLVMKIHSKVGSLTHWGWVTHICVSNLTIIGPDNGLSPGRRQAIIWTNAGILSIGTLGTNFSEILIEILTFSFKNMLLKVSSGKWQPFCLSPNVLKANVQNSNATPYIPFEKHGS